MHFDETGRGGGLATEEAGRGGEHSLVDIL